MNSIYAVCYWVLEPEHFDEHQYFYAFLNAAMQLNCEIWRDWWSSPGNVPTVPLYIKAASVAELNALVKVVGSNLGMTEWHEVTLEEFEKITQNGQIPSLHAIRARDSHYLGRTMEGRLGVIYRFKRGMGNFLW